MHQHFTQSITMTVSPTVAVPKRSAVRLVKPKPAKVNGRAPAIDPRVFLAERLELSGITQDEARHAGIRAMTVAEARKQGYELPANCTDGFVLPYHDVKGAVRGQMWRWRNNPALVKGFSRLTDDPLSGFRYVQPAATACEVYWPRVHGLDWEKVPANP